MTRLFLMIGMARSTGQAGIQAKRGLDKVTYG